MCGEEEEREEQNKYDSGGVKIRRRKYKRQSGSSRNKQDTQMCETVKPLPFLFVLVLSEIPIYDHFRLSCEFL